MKRGSRAIEFSAEDLLNLSRNPELYDQMLAEIAERKDEAEKAIVENRAVLAESEKKKEENDAANKAADEAVERHLKEGRAEIEKGQADNKREQERLNDEDQRLTACEFALDERDRIIGITVEELRVSKQESDATSERLAAQAEAIEAREAGLDERETKLGVRLEAITARESRIDEYKASL